MLFALGDIAQGVQVVLGERESRGESVDPGSVRPQLARPARGETDDPTLLAT